MILFLNGKVGCCQAFFSSFLYDEYIIVENREQFISDKKKNKIPWHNVGEYDSINALAKASKKGLELMRVRERRKIFDKKGKGRKT
jgi:hypothetical protein